MNLTNLKNRPAISKTLRRQCSLYSEYSLNDLSGKAGYLPVRQKCPRQYGIGELQRSGMTFLGSQWQRLFETFTGICRCAWIKPQGTFNVSRNN